MSRARTLYLVDGTYLLFRAFHSLPPTMAVTGVQYEKIKAELASVLRGGAGAKADPAGVSDPALEWLEDPARDRIPTNAVRGLTSVLLKLIREERPAHLVVAFDLPGRVHRDDHYRSFVERHPDYAEDLAGYKATRPETPVEIHVQYPLARIVCGRALGLPVAEAEGFEADDLIGTLAQRARERGDLVRLVTADKDLFQLVGEGISILNPHKPDPSGSSSYLLMDEDVVEEEFGVPPSRVVDVLALMGDASDNIPGVPGVGEKGAKELVRRFGSVEACIEAAKDENKITRASYRKGLVEHAALALFSKELATIRKDAPVDVDLGMSWSGPPDWQNLREVFGLLAFGTLLKDAEALREAGGFGAGQAGASTAGAGGGLSRPADAPGAEAPAVRARDSRDRPEARGGEGLRLTPPAAEEAGSGDARGRQRSGAGRGTAPPAAEGAREGVETEPGGGRYRIVLDASELKRMMPSILGAPRVAVDTETTSQDPMKAVLVGVSLAWEPHSAVYIPLGHRYLGAPEQPAKEEILQILSPLIDSKERIKVGQNVKYDIEVLIRSGAKPAGFDFDTMIAAFLLESDRNSFALGVLAKEYLGDYKMDFAEVAGRGGKQVTFDQVDVERAAEYSGRDADVTLRLAEVLDGKLRAESLLPVFETIDMPLVEVLVEMEMSGVRIDLDLLRRLSKEMGEQIATLRAEIHALAGHEFNIDSPKQLSAVLFGELGLKPVSRTAKSGAASTRDEDLEQLAARHPLPARVRDYRTLSKLRSTYVDALPAMINAATGRVHTSFHPTGAATGRLSSSDPNLQNIPVRTPEGRKIRAAFVPEPGWRLISADYSQVELRVLAEMSGDPDLISTFRREEDIHRLTASKIFGIGYQSVSPDQRRAAKTINFGILYGMGPQRLSKDLSISLGEAKELIESYFGRFPKIRDYIDATIGRAERDGQVSTLFGRIRRFPQILSTSRFQRQNAIRAAVNSTIQGTAADLMKIAMLRLHRMIRERGMKARLLIQVHDELVLEAPPQEVDELQGVVREAMEKVPRFEVPLTVELSVGSSWLEAKS